MTYIMYVQKKKHAYKRGLLVLTSLQNIGKCKGAKNLAREQADIIRHHHQTRTRTSDSPDFVQPSFTLGMIHDAAAPPR